MTARFATLALALCLSLSASTTALAESSVSAEPRDMQASRPMPATTRLKLFGAGFAGAGLALAASAGVGVALYEAQDCEHDCREDENFGPGITSVALSSMLVLVTVPVVSSLAVHKVARRNGHRGRYGYTLLSSVGGMGIGAGAGFLTFLATGDDPHNERRFRLGLASASIVGVACVSGFALLGQRLSDRRRVELSPALAPNVQTGGLSMGLAGRF